MQEQIEAVQKMQDYIGAHLYENITLADLAKVSLFSPWYSYRLFVHHLGMTPAEYIRKLRLSKSGLKLRDDECKIADVAFEIGFGSVDGYQRAFFREFGYNPREYASKPVPLNLFTPYGVKFKNIERRKVMENLKNVFIQVIGKPARKVIIKRGVKARDYLFQGEPFAEEDYSQAIEEVWTSIKKYDPSIIGYSWDDTNPRIQLEPIGTRGYIELCAIKSVIIESIY